MIPEVEQLERDTGDTRMKFRIGEKLTGLVRQAAKDFDAEEELVLECLIHEGLYNDVCLRCGQINPASAQICQRCGMEIEQNENNPKVVNLSAKKVLLVDSEVESSEEVSREVSEE